MMKEVENDDPFMDFSNNSNNNNNQTQFDEFGEPINRPSSQNQSMEEEDPFGGPSTNSNDVSSLFGGDQDDPFSSVYNSNNNIQNNSSYFDDPFNPAPPENDEPNNENNQNPEEETTIEGAQQVHSSPSQNISNLNKSSEENKVLDQEQSQDTEDEPQETPKNQPQDDVASLFGENVHDDHGDVSSLFGGNDAPLNTSGSLNKSNNQLSNSPFMAESNDHESNSEDVSSLFGDSTDKEKSQEDVSSLFGANTTNNNNNPSNDNNNNSSQEDVSSLFGGNDAPLNTSGSLNKSNNQLSPFMAESNDHESNSEDVSSLFGDSTDKEKSQEDVSSLFGANTTNNNNNPSNDNTNEDVSSLFGGSNDNDEGDDVSSLFGGPPQQISTSSNNLSSLIPESNNTNHKNDSNDVSSLFGSSPSQSTDDVSSLFGAPSQNQSGSGGELDIQEMPDLFGGNSTATDFFSNLGNTKKEQPTPVVKTNTNVVVNSTQNDFWGSSNTNNQNVDFSSLIGLDKQKPAPVVNQQPKEQPKTNNQPMFFQPTLNQPPKEQPKPSNQPTFFQPTNQKTDPPKTNTNVKQTQPISFFDPSVKKETPKPVFFQPTEPPKTSVQPVVNKPTQETTKTSNPIKFFQQDPRIQQEKPKTTTTTTNNKVNNTFVEDVPSSLFDQPSTSKSTDDLFQTKVPPNQPTTNFNSNVTQKKAPPKIDFFEPVLQTKKPEPPKKVQNDDFDDIPLSDDNGSQDNPPIDEPVSNKTNNKPSFTQKPQQTKPLNFFDPSQQTKENHNKPQKKYEFESRPNLQQNTPKKSGSFPGMDDSGDFVDVNINSSQDGMFGNNDDVSFTPHKTPAKKNSNPPLSFFDPTPVKEEVKNDRKGLYKSHEGFPVNKQLSQSNENLHFSTDSFFNEKGFFGEENKPSYDDYKAPSKATNYEYIKRDYEHKGAHPIFCFGMNGNFVSIFPPKDVSYNATYHANVTTTKNLLQKTSHYQQMAEFVGPINKASKQKTLDFIKKKIEAVEFPSNQEKEESQILLWELLRLMIKYEGSLSQIAVQKEIQNDKTDTLDQLTNLLKSNLKGYSSWVGENQKKRLSVKTRDPSEEEQFLHNLQSLLCQGKTKEAVDLAVENQMWEHAFFIARQIDISALNNVMAKFANEGASSDGTPLKTFYLLTSGQIQNVFNESESRSLVSNWREHLSMIVSNRSSNKAAIIGKMGDVLWTKMRMPEAAHFCYLLAGTNLMGIDDPRARIVLIGGDHKLKKNSFIHDLENIQRTEIYEYCLTLANTQFSLPQFQVYKYYYATLLAEMGFVDQALNYCKCIESTITETNNSFKYNVFLKRNLVDFRERLTTESFFLKTGSNISKNLVSGFGRLLTGTLSTILGDDKDEEENSNNATKMETPNNVNRTKPVRNNSNNNFGSDSMVTPQKTTVPRSPLETFQTPPTSGHRSPPTPEYNTAKNEQKAEKKVEKKEEKKIEEKTEEKPKSQGLFSSIFSKIVGGGKAKNEVNLGETNKMVWNEELQRWVTSDCDIEKLKKEMEDDRPPEDLADETPSKQISTSSRQNFMQTNNNSSSNENLHGGFQPQNNTQFVNNFGGNNNNRVQFFGGNNVPSTPISPSNQRKVEQQQSNNSSNNPSTSTSNSFNDDPFSSSDNNSSGPNNESGELPPSSHPNNSKNFGGEDPFVSSTPISSSRLNKKKPRAYLDMNGGLRTVATTTSNVSKPPSKPTFAMFTPMFVPEPVEAKPEEKLQQTPELPHNDVNEPPSSDNNDDVPPPGDDLPPGDDDGNGGQDNPASDDPPEDSNFDDSNSLLSNEIKPKNLAFEEDFI